MKSYIWGDFIITKNQLVINLRLIDTESNQIIKTYSEEDHPDSIIQISRTLSKRVRNYLEIEALEGDIDRDYLEFAETNSAEAYRHFIEGMNSIVSRDYELAIQSLKKATEIDSTFTFAAFYLAWAYGYDIWMGSFEPEQWIKWTKKAYVLKDQLPLNYRRWLELWYAITVSKNLRDILNYCSLLENSDIKSRLFWFDLGSTYFDIQQPHKAVESFAKIEEFNQQIGDDWEYLLYYWYYGYFLIEVGNYDKAEEILKLGEKNFPNTGRIKMRLASCSFLKGDTSEANLYIEQVISIMEGYNWAKSDIDRNIGSIYEEANILDMAETCYRNVYKFNQHDPENILTLASFLIRYEINIDEGMELTQKGLEIDPENLDLLWTKGLGCFKQDKFKEALKLLRDVENSVQYFSYSCQQQIQEVEQALAREKVTSDE